LGRSGLFEECCAGCSWFAQGIIPVRPSVRGRVKPARAGGAGKSLRGMGEINFGPVVTGGAGLERGIVSAWRLLPGGIKEPAARPPALRRYRGLA